MADDSMALGYALGQDSNNGNGNGMWGGDGWWAIILFAMIFGWGRGGFGFGGFGGGASTGNRRSKPDKSPSSRRRSSPPTSQNSRCSG